MTGLPTYMLPLKIKNVKMPPLPSKQKIMVGTAFNGVHSHLKRRSAFLMHGKIKWWDDYKTKVIPESNVDFGANKVESCFV